MFSEIMEKCHPGDFQRVRPWGNIGDLKNDGYLKSQRTLFQVYAPNELTAAKAIIKIDEDFNGALPHWEKYFDRWVFVHNSRPGLGPEVLKKLLELENSNPPIKIEHWGFEELRQKVFSLNEFDIESLLGPSPSSNDMLDVGFEDLKVVLETIAEQQPIEDPDLRPVPREKVAANALSEDVEILLKAGMIKASLVERFFTRYYDPTFGDKIATAFKDQYNNLKDTGYLPDIIFMKLQEFAGGGQRGSPKHESAVLAVIAHLFENCDIFENPSTGELL
ncbi:hypothetical protein KA005_61200 [bacterium]|nr:hypothetical protein [bacterium]